MQFSSVALLLLGATGILAAPTTNGPNPEYSELHRQVQPNGEELVFYGPSDVSSKMVRRQPTTLNKRCGSAHLVCDGSNGANNDVCTTLVSSLYSDSNSPVGESPRQICYFGQNGDPCCVSWGTPIPGLHQGDLAPLADRMNSVCKTNGVSGEIYDTVVVNTCVNVCLSDRGTHCT